MDLGPWEILIIAVVVLVLFGSKKLPDAARSIGRSLRIFKTEVKGLHDDEPAAPAAAPPAQLPAATPSPPVEQTQPASTAGERPDAR
jgi:sec-independent protein translocase protein TatA